MTSENYLLKYEEILKKDGKIVLKTDNPILLKYTLNKKWLLENISLNYRHSEEMEDFSTEDEDKFRKKGMKRFSRLFTELKSPETEKPEAAD